MPHVTYCQVINRHVVYIYCIISVVCLVLLKFMNNSQLDDTPQKITIIDAFDMHIYMNVVVGQN